MLLGRLRIRGKLALLVVIPLLSMVALAVPVVVDRVAVARRAAAIADQIRVASRIGTLVQDLQQERLLSIGYLLGIVDRSQLVQKSATVTDRVADIRSDLGPLLTGRVRAALADVPKLGATRTGVLTNSATPDQVMSAFGPIDTTLIDSLRLQFDVDTRTTAGRQVLALDALLRTDEGVSTGATLVVLLVATKSQQVASAYIANLAALQVNNQRFRSLATPEQFTLGLLEDEAVAARTSRDFLTAGAVDPAGALAGAPLETMFPAVASMITLGQFVEKKVATDVITEVRGQQRRALTAAYVVAGLALLILLTVIGLSVLVARTVAAPLTRLTRSADRVARLAEAELVRIADDEAEPAAPVRLDPVDVTARDEVGDLARAFDRVQGTAARLVERQVASRRNVAQMFGHVGRRTQNLVGRQLSIIDRLERRETDPDRLQHLYRLDHVASRLRRSASSLLVLSGAAGVDNHVAPVSLADVVRLALGEIEDYPRVDIQVRPDVMVAPAVIGDLVLALAELMENATASSPPHTRVTVSGDRVPGGARVTLVDHGIGMTDERLAEENARITRRERLDLAPTEVLGLFVVGRLARRHDWRVRLSATPGGGVTAELDIDERLLVAGRPTQPPAAVARATVAPASLDRPGPASAPLVIGWTPAGARPVLALDASPAGAGEPDAPAPTAALAGPVYAPPAGPVSAAPTGPVSPAAGPMDVGEPVEIGEPTGSATIGFSVELLYRATRSLESGQPWDAFAAARTPQADQTAQADRTPASPAGGVATIFLGGLTAPAHTATAPGPAATTPGPAATTPGAGATAPGAGATAPSAGGGAPAEDAVRRDLPARGSAAVRSGPPGLRRRVPGSQLPIAGRPAGASSPAPAGSAAPTADPVAVRALVEQFEAGVRRAKQDSAPLPTADPAGTGASTGRDPRTRPDTGADGVGAGRPQLTQRVPGANLTLVTPTGRPAPQPASTTPPDPEEARLLVTQFEAGVARALSEIGSDHRNEEEAPR